MTTKRMMMILDRERRADGDGRAKGRHFRGPSSPWPTLLFPFLLLLLLILSTTASRAANHHRRRQTDPHNNVNIVFRYQCPQGCLCVPDVSEIELLIVSCRWPSLPANAFEQFPKNGTKSLTIHCTDTGLDPDHQSALAMPGTFLGFTGLRELKIAGCQSRHLAGHLFLGATRLRSLSLTQMPALGSLEPSFFSHLALLEKLTLAETGLREMPEDGLCPLRHLQVLNFSQNALQSARLGIFLPRPADQLCQLGELLMLDLSANSIQVLAEQDLRPFPALRQLSLRANGMVEIQPDAFRSGPVPLLQHLDLASNRLSLLPAGLPEGLLHLDLANNQFRHQIPPAAAQLAGLARLNLAGNEIGPELDEKSPLQSSALEQLDLSWNQLERIPVGLFADSADSLKTLRLAGNAIERLEPGQMQNLSALQELDLSSNRLAALSFGAFEGLTELAILNLANNSIGQVDAEVFQELGTNLHTLTMSRNQLTELPMAVGRLTRAKRIDLSRNQISKAYKFVLNKLPHLSRLDLGHNALESVDSYVFNGCDHLQELSIRANRIEAISPDAFEKCPRLRRIDLAENRLATLGPAMSGLRALRSVNLTGNGLEELNWAHFPATVLEILANGNGIKRIVGTLAGQEEQFEEETAGGDGRKLKRLELKANRMTRLLADSLPQSLEELDLAENQLASLTNSSFRGMTQLKMVNLRSNKLRLVPKELFELIMANAPYGQMRIADNPQLECNCEMGWLQNASANVVRDIADAAATEYMNTLSIDAWTTDEILDGISVANTTEIGSKSLVLANIQPPIVCRYVKLTYVVRQLYHDPCTVPLGQFFGTRFISPWQISSKDATLSKAQYFDTNKLLPDFVRLSEHIRALYEHCASVLKSMLRDGSGPLASANRSIRNQYRECFMLRLEYNTVRNLIERLEGDTRPVGPNESRSPSNSNGWNLCEVEQLASMANQLVALLNLYSVYFDGRQGIMRVQNQPMPPQIQPLLTLETAILHFGQFCIDSLAQLRMECAAWLFHHGVYTDWWDEFFPEVLSQYFSSTKSAKTLDSAFILLSYLCNETAKYPRFQTKVVKKLIESVLAQLENENCDKNTGQLKQQSKTLLSWTLTLIASVFDVIISKKRQNDRWIFLTGDFGRNESGSSAISGHDGHGLQRGYAIKKKYGTAGLGSTGTNSSQQKVLFPMKNYYKKLSDQLEKMKQNESISQAKLEKLKNRLSHMQSLYAKFKQQDNQQQQYASPLHTTDSLAGPSTSSAAPSSSTAAPSTLQNTTSTGQQQQSHKLRQYSIHLHLPSQLCLRLVKALLKLLTQRSSDTTQLQLHTQLIAFKVIAKICVHGTLQPLPLSLAFDGQIKQILSLALNDFDEPWMRHALLSMFLDISEAEIRALAKDLLVQSLTNSDAKKGNPSSSSIERKTTTFDSSAASPTQGDAKRRKEDLFVEFESDSCNFVERMETNLETLYEETNERDDEDSLLSTAARNQQQHFLNTLIDTTFTEAQQMAAANLIPSNSLSQQQDTTSEFEFDTANLLQFNANLEHLASAVNVQPTISKIERPTESALTENVIVSNCRKMALLQNTIIRNSFRRLILLRSVLSPSDTLFNREFEQQEKDEQLFTLLGQCMQTTLKAIDELLSGLHNSAFKVRPCFVERLLDFYWQYQSNIAAFLSSKSNSAASKSDLFRAQPLSASAALALISYAADNPFMSENGWSRVLTILNISIRQEPNLIDAMVKSAKLHGFFQYFCFIGPSNIQAANVNTGIGPGLEAIFEHFVHLLVTKSTTPALANLLADTLIFVYSKKSLSLSKFSIEALLKISRVLAQCSDKYAQHCDLNKFVRLYATLIRFSNKFLRESSDPDKCGPSSPEKDKSINAISMYSHYGNGQSFTTINSPPKQIIFNNPAVNQVLNHGGKTVNSLTNDPLELLGGPTLPSAEELDSHIMIPGPSDAIKNSSMLGSKKIMPKAALKAIQQASKDPSSQNFQVPLSAIDELPFPMLQATEEQMADIVEAIEASGPFYSTPAPMWTFPIPPGSEYSVGIPYCPWANAANSRGKRPNIGSSMVVVHADKNESILCNCMKTICLLIRANPNFAPLILQQQLDNQSDILVNTIEFLANCELSRGQTLESISTEKWKLVTLGDSVLYSLLTLSQHLDPKSSQTIGHDQSRQFLKLFVEQLRNAHTNNILCRQLSKRPTLTEHQHITEKIVFIDADDKQSADQQQQKEAPQEKTLDRPMELPAPLAFLLLQITKEPHRRSLFIELDGHQFIAEQLQQSILAFAEIANSAWPQGSSSFTEVQRQLRTIASQISGSDPRNLQMQQSQQQQIDGSSSIQKNDQNIGNQSISFGYGKNQPTNQTASNNGFGTASSSFGGTVKKQICAKFGGTSGNEIDPQQKPQLYNYAPNCMISSSSAMAHHLQLLLSANIPHRRSRNPNWTYHFPAHQQWIDMTLTLPYPIMLKEVVIKPHISSLLSAPSAVQTELCSDQMGISWSPVQSPIQTLGCSRIAIPTTSYKYPVNAVRLYLKKPLETNSLGLMQIQLNGSTQLTDLQQHHTPKQQLDILHRWLFMFHQIIVISPVVEIPITVSSQLIGQLVQLFLGNPAHPGDQVLQLLYRVLLDIDNEKSKVRNKKNADESKSIVQHLIEHILTDHGLLSEKINVQIAELLFTLCTPSSKKIPIDNDIFTTRQHELLEGIIGLLDLLVLRPSEESDDAGKWELDSDPKVGLLALLMWSAACTLWQNAEPNSAYRAQTINLCEKIAPKILESLAHLSLSNNQRPSSLFHSPFAEHIQKASRWLLCSIIRTNPDHLDRLFQFYGFDDDPLPENLKVLSAIGHICQSKPAIDKLHSNFYLETWIQKAVQICEYDDKTLIDLNQLLAIVECIETLSVMSDICRLLEKSDNGPAFFRRLMHFLVNCQQQAGGIVTGDMISRLRTAFISLARRCLAFGGQHRPRISRYLCELLRNSSSSQLDNNYVPTGALNEFLLQLLHRLLLDDEIIKVHFKNVIQLSANREVLVPLHESIKRMAHPIFGCNSDDVVLEMSLYTKCHELVPKGMSKECVGARKSAKDLKQTAGTSGDAKYSAADQWLKSHGFIPPPSTAIAIESGASLDWDMEMDDEWSTGTPPPSWNPTEQPVPKYVKKPSRPIVEKPGNENEVKKRTIQLIDGNTNKQLDGEKTLAELLKNRDCINEETSDNDYMVLTMSLRYDGTGVSDPRLNRQSQVQKPTESTTPPKELISTLEHFARANGLYELSKHMYLYQQCLTRLLNSCDNVSANLVERQQQRGHAANPYAMDPTTSQQPGMIGIYDDFEFIEDIPHYGLTGSAPTTMVPPVPNFILNIPAGLSMEMADEMPPPNTTQWQWGSNMDTQAMGFMPQYGALCKRNRPGAGNLPTEQLLYNSAHVITSLGLFLRLDKYAELFIRMDRLKAKRLIRMALNIRIAEPVVATQIDKLRPRPSNADFIKSMATEKMQPALPPSIRYTNNPSTIATTTSSTTSFPTAGAMFPPPQYAGSRFCIKTEQPDVEKESILLFPYVVLARLFNDFNPEDIGILRAQSIREQALQLGIIDVLLEQLYHYSHQPARCQALRSNGGHHEPMVHLISHVLAAVTQLEQLWQTMGITMATNMDVYGGGGPPPGTFIDNSTPSTQTSMATSAPTTQAGTALFGAPATASVVSQNQQEGSGGSITGTTGPNETSNKPQHTATTTISTTSSTVAVSTNSNTTAMNAAAANTDGGYWAKGTGFGSGTTQQQWNLNQHVAKKRQDENNVACLLNILISFINPQPPTIASEQNSTEGDTSSLVDLVLPMFANSSESNGQGTIAASAAETLTKEEQFEHKTPEGEEEDIGQQLIQLPEEFIDLIYRSCLKSTVNSHLMNDSVLDISKRVFVFESVISLVSALAKTPSIPVKDHTKFHLLHDAKMGNESVDVFDILLLNEDKLVTTADRKQAEGELLSRLKNLGRNIEIYLKKLQTGQGKNAAQGSSSQMRQSSSKKRQRQTERKAWRTTSSAVQNDLDEEEELGKLHELVNDACSAIEKKMAKHAVEEQEKMDFEEHRNAEAGSSSGSKELSISMELLYCQTFKGMQFETIPFYDGSSLRIPFHYSSSLTTVGQSAGMSKRTRRLAQEIVSLSTSLPLSASSSVFVRTSEERLDAMKVLITGPAETPYSNGCFEFDVFFPPDYPNLPMQMNLETTGNKTVRFNPNLYDDGKVCLSILNTWRGRPEERWNADTSSLLQVLVSIQSLILVQEPYFNEPGYERWRNSPAGQQASREYDANIRQMCVRWAMVEQIRNPPKAFAEVIRRHFWLKRDEICDQIEDWIDDCHRYIISKAGASKTLPSYLAGLRKQYDSLKKEFAQMQCPPGLEDRCQSSRFGGAQGGSVIVEEQANNDVVQEATSKSTVDAPTDAIGKLKPVGIEEEKEETEEENKPADKGTAD